MFRGADGRVLAPNAVVVEHRHELRFDELGVGIRAKALQDGRVTLRLRTPGTRNQLSNPLMPI